MVSRLCSWIEIIAARPTSRGIMGIVHRPLTKSVDALDTSAYLAEYREYKAHWDGML
jgi:hypothetical protein